MRSEEASCGLEKDLKLCNPLSVVNVRNGTAHNVEVSIKVSTRTRAGRGSLSLFTTQI